MSRGVQWLDNVWLPGVGSIAPDVEVHEAFGIAGAFNVLYDPVTGLCFTVVDNVDAIWRLEETLDQYEPGEL